MSLKGAVKDDKIVILRLSYPESHEKITWRDILFWRKKEYLIRIKPNSGRCQPNLFIRNWFILKKIEYRIFFVFFSN